MASRFNLEKTKSWWFLTPILELDQYNLNYKYLLNVYLGYEDNKEYENTIIFHYDFAMPGGNFAKLDRNLKYLPNFVTTIDPDEYTILYVFKIPNHWYNDYLLFINGAYSKLSERYVNLLKNFYTLSGDHRKLKEIMSVINKSEERRRSLEEKLDVVLPENAEVSGIIEWRVETYSFEQYGIKNPLSKTEFEQL